MPITDLIAHRPWPLPRRPWCMAQTWHDLLFAHWRVPVAAVRARVPSAFEVDTHGGAAWVGVVPFRMSGVRLRWLPPVPGCAAFPELNLRTYVTHAGKPGVYFFALDAASALAVAAARASFHLPYFHARMRCERDGDAIEYASERTQRGAPPARFTARYAPSGSAFQARPGTLEHWLTERYCLYTLDRAGRALRGEIHHPPWPLQPATAVIREQTLARAQGIELPGNAPDAAPLLHFARRQDVVVWWPERCAD